MSPLDGVRALVTGGTSGLGLAMAGALAQAGAKVVLSGRDGERAAAVAAQLGAELDSAEARPGRLHGVAMDVRDESSVRAGVDAAVGTLGRIDVLVNNAGIGMRAVNPAFLSRPQPFWQVEPDRFRAVLETNLTGYFLVARAVVPAMVERGHGKVVNVSINEATMRRAGFTPYGPSRAGSDALSHIMAADLAGTGVTVNLLAPGGATATGMIPAEVPDRVRASLLDPAIMGPPICWLASTDSDGVSDARMVATEFAAAGPPARKSSAPEV